MSSHYKQTHNKQQPNAAESQAISNASKLQNREPDIMQLQKTIGNRAIGSMLSAQSALAGSSGSGMAIQTKLSVGPVGDAYEQEADQMGKAVVDQISSMSDSTGAAPIQRAMEEEELQMKPSTETIQRAGVDEEELQMKPSAETIQRAGVDEEELQMKPSAETIQRAGVDEEELQMKPSADGFDTSSDIENQIKQKQGSGSKLDSTIQAKMENAFGSDFSNVNIHADAEADQLNQSIGAEAFATGNDIFFREGQYNPGSRQGQELLGHELTHVVQQTGKQ
jgi:hypothetical protein